MKVFLCCIKFPKKKAESKEPTNNEYQNLSNSYSIISIKSSDEKSMGSSTLLKEKCNIVVDAPSADDTKNYEYIQRKRPKAYNLCNNTITVRHIKDNNVGSMKYSRIIRIKKNQATVPPPSL
ncbi:unnamed protein product [Blepharisma stoltei]|uniref:Uncharacterized protein n=1 Tax=Blepharisma stoltei TaxID=1481888 RepID=A0AAU9JM17_9CILI|nr:unnamed protein product [Blepharisma stoltei]